jgi:flagellar basal-body rod modification protein FlgD
MAISPISSSPSASATLGTSTTVRTPKQTLDAGDLMKLLSVQMQNQDPMKPMDNNEQMAQMAQMGSMQSMAQMAVSVTEMSAGQTLLLANSYLGKQVSLMDAEGKAVAGQVTAVDASGGTPKIMVGQTYYPLSAITRVDLQAPAPVATPGP